MLIYWFPKHKKVSKNKILEKQNEDVDKKYSVLVT